MEGEAHRASCRSGVKKNDVITRRFLFEVGSPGGTPPSAHPEEAASGRSGPGGTGRGIGRCPTKGRDVNGPRRSVFLRGALPGYAGAGFDPGAGRGVRTGRGAAGGRAGILFPRCSVASDEAGKADRAPERREATSPRLAERRRRSHPIPETGRPIRSGGPLGRPPSPRRL